MEEAGGGTGHSDEARERLWRKRLEIERRYQMLEGDEDAFYSKRKALSVWSVRAVLQTVGLYERGMRNAMQPSLKRLDFRFANLPGPLDGLRILHLSDFHFRERAPELAGAVAACLRGVEADVCCMTGDFRFGYYGPSSHVWEQLAVVLDGVSVGLGCYAVLGNHDVSVLREGLADLGVRLLVNAGTAIEVNGAEVWIAGIDDPHDFQCASVPHAMMGAPAGAFRVLLAHTPQVVHEARAHGVSLYLCGHTHGCQVRFPLIGAVLTNAPGVPRQCLMGPWHLNGMQGHTSAGLGTTDLPVRYNCPPEAALITLRSCAPA